MVQRRLAPSAILSQAARAIHDAGLPLRIYGQGWDKLDWAKDLYQGQAGEPARRLDVLGQSHAVILGDMQPGQASLALEAAAAGSVIMARTLWPASDPADLFTPGKEIVSWTGQQELLDRLRQMLRNDTVRDEMTGRARDRALHEHTASIRLAQILEASRTS